MAMPKMTTLLVRHLPAELDNQEKIDLICHFGADRVRPMGTKGRMKNTAFAQFSTPEAAERCLARLHQLEVLGHKLVVEYAKSDQIKYFPTALADEKSQQVTKDASDGLASDDVVTLHADSVVNSDPTFKKHDIPYTRKPTLHYLYPPPTVSILANIANALASHPKFYTQVLHLMNKLNLPCPFGAVTSSPPLALDSNNMQKSGVKRNARDYTGYTGDIEEVEMEHSSTEESEIESDTENKKLVNISGDNQPQRIKIKRPRKKMRLVQPDMTTMVKPSIVPQPNEVFEDVDKLKPSHIVFNISEKSITESAQVNRNQPETQSIPEAVTVVEGGFGKVEPPQVKPKLTEEIDKSDVNYKIDPKKFLSKKKITSGRLKSDQMKEFSVFKKYSSGEPASRLYIKNLTKHSTEQDLVDLFGSFVDWTSSLAQEAFDIRLMKEGRMKGQAFVTLPDEDSAKDIVKECNGFVMNGKPIVIQFARSVKAKQVDKPDNDDEEKS